MKIQFLCGRGAGSLSDDIEKRIKKREEIEDWENRKKNAQKEIMDVLVENKMSFHDAEYIFHEILESIKSIPLNVLADHSYS